jgi:cation diffusion facilitator family transporter
MNNQKSMSSAATVGWVSIAGNLLLAIGKFVIGIQSGSVAIVADAWHTISDSISSIIMLFGIHAANKPADDEHPFGHGRAQLIASLIIGTLLVVIAGEFMLKGASQLYHGKTAKYGTAAIVIMVISIIIKEAMAQYAFMVARQTGMTIVKADAWHHRSDALSSAIILFGIFFSNYFWWIDGVLAILIAIIILHAALDIIKQVTDQLLGQPPKKALEQQINKICNQCCGMNIETHHLHIHSYGAHSELTFHIRLNGDLPLKITHNYTKK